MKSAKNLFVILLIGLLFFTSVLVLFPPAKAETWTDITLPYTITESGNYRITQQWNGTGIGLAINASDVVVDGQNYLINLTRAQGDNGVRINNGSQNVLLQNLKIRNAFVGVHALSGNFTLSNSTLNFNLAGLFANCSEHFDVLNCNLTFNLAVNFFAKSSSHFTVKGCNINNGTLAGVIATYSNNFDFIDSKINNNPAGVLVRDAQNFTFTNCDIKNNTPIGFIAGLADNFTFTGCNLSNNTLSSTIASSNNFTIQNSILNNNVYGLVGANVTNFVIGNSNINNNTLGSLLGVASHFAIQNCSYDNNLLGLEIVEAGNFTIQNCSYDNNLLGLEIVEAGNFTIQNSIMNSSYYGLLALDNNNFTVQNCNFSNNTRFGLKTAYNDNALITNNVFTGNGFNNEEDDIVGSGLIADDTNCTVTNNSFISNNDALFWSVYDEEENNTALFYSNVFTNNNYTFFFNYALPNNFTNQKLFFYNNYVNDPAYVDPSSFNDSYSGPYMPFNPAVINFNTTLQSGTRPYSSGRMIGGNYWAHPNGTGPSQTGTDANRDGFVDTAFDLFGNGTIYDSLPYSSSYVSNFTFTAGTNQTLVANQTSAPLTVQIKDFSGNITSGVTVNLSSNSSTGKFYSDQAATTQISNITIPAGSSTGSFYFKDTSTGTPTITTNAQGVTAATTNLTINAHSSTVDHITISPNAATIPAGNAINYTTTAYDQYGNSWNVTATYTINDFPLDGNTVSVTVPDSYVIATNFDGQTASTTLTVTVGELNRFIVLTPNTAIAGTPFSVMVIALDDVGNTVTSFAGTVSFGASHGTITPSTSGAFLDGMWIGRVSVTDVGSIVITVNDGNGHNGISNSISVSSPTPTPSPTPSSSPTSTIQATTSSGTTVNLAIEGNITTAQISGATITTNQSAATTTISFTVTGQSGTTGFSNMTIPKSQVPYGTTPTINIDGQPAQNQGFTQDDENYYVWYTTSFSTHQVQIQFTGQTTGPQTPTIWYALIVVVAVIAVAIALVVSKRKHAKPIINSSLL